MEAWFSMDLCHYLQRWSSFVHRVITYTDDGALFTVISRDGCQAVISGGPFTKMMEPLLKCHLWRWICGFQVVISGIFTEMMESFSRSHTCKWKRGFQAVISGMIYRDGDTYRQVSIPGMMKLFFKESSSGIETRFSSRYLWHFYRAFLAESFLEIKPAVNMRCQCHLCEWCQR